MLGFFKGKTPSATTATTTPQTQQSTATSDTSSISGSEHKSTTASDCVQTSFFAHGPRQSWRRKHRSSRLSSTEPYEKPWTAKKDPKEKWERIIFFGGIVLAFGVGAVVCWHDWTSVTNADYCLVMSDSFSEINPDTWSYEVQLGNYGNGAFDWTTSDPSNAYTDASGLHIVPTLTTESTSITGSEIYNGYSLNLTESGTCTGTSNATCAVSSNMTLGTMIPPVRSARLSTKGKASIRYGRVEVTARMPVGDWLWPAIWMLPETDTYGTWPASGEIDILESRGNLGSNYATGGRNAALSTLHWGPTPATDAYFRTGGDHRLQRGDYSQEFHTYGLEWSERYMFLYIDSRLLQVFFIRFPSSSSMWQRGKFSSMIFNDTITYQNPWAAGGPNAPFDQEFYLILNVAVGATNGYFPDGVGGKPWVDGSEMAMSQFWNASSSWLPTWGEGKRRGMTVSKVEMWREGPCGGT